MTAKKVLDDIEIWDGVFVHSSNAEKAMIKFAKYHVKQALEEALYSIPCLGSNTDIPTYEEVEKEVLNSYPLKNIK